MEEARACPRPPAYRSAYVVYTWLHIAPIACSLSPPRPWAEQPRTQPPKVTWLFLGLDLCQQ